MRFQLLGSLRLWDGTRWSELRAAQQRAVLAILLTEAGRAVSTDRLIDELWGERPPRAAVGTIQGYVMHLRRALGGDRDSTLVTRGRGYALLLGEQDVDAAVFDHAVEQGRRCVARGQLERAVAHWTDALALWRGPALADVPATPTVAAAAQRLEQSRLTVLEQRLDARLELGQHAELVDELDRLVREHPLRERFWAQLMTALHRSGRRAEALAAYRRARDGLVSELGLEPGRELTELQSAILADAAWPASPATITPAQLPADVAAFTGRDADLARLDALLPTERVLVIAAVAGAAGVGKTALATHWAHRVSHRFPDGQLHVNLRGYAEEPPLRPIDALARFLHALGVPPKDVPLDVEEAAALYRSALAGKRMLVLLDNAAHPDQVRPLLPGRPGCLVLVTSRDELGGLVARDGASRITLDVLTPDEAHRLLTRLVGAARIDAEPAAAARLAALCGYLPLALRIVAANLLASPASTIAAYTGRLANGDRLGALQVAGDPQASVRIAFDHSYAALPASAARLFRLLGLVPGPTVDAPAAAALAELPAADAAALLDQLGRAHLVEEHAGRYSLHDLLRQHAAERARAEETGADLDAAAGRLLDHYLRTAGAAADQLYPQILRAPGAADEAGRPFDDAGRPFGDAAEASAWLDGERANLIAAVAHDDPELAEPRWRLADALRGYLYLRMYTVDWAAVVAAGLAAAELTGDPYGLASAHISRATLDWAQGRHERAVAEFGIALARASEAGWTAGESAALGNLGNLHWAAGRLRAAADHYTQALALHRQTGQAAGQATALGNLGLAHFGLGELDTAVGHYSQALALHRRSGSRSGEARTLTHLGEVQHARGRLDEALATLTEALAAGKAVGDRNIEGDTMRTLAAVHRDAGRLAEAYALADAAVTLARDTGDQRLEAGALTTRASVRQALGRPAIEDHQHALALARAVGNRAIEVEALTGLAIAYRDAGQLADAGRLGEEALATARDSGYRLLERRARAVLDRIPHPT